eukprot:7382722-Prymnesium_polylepis.1
MLQIDHDRHPLQRQQGDAFGRYLVRRRDRLRHHIIQLLAGCVVARSGLSPHLGLADHAGALAAELARWRLLPRRFFAGALTHGSADLRFVLAHCDAKQLVLPRRCRLPAACICLSHAVHHTRFDRHGEVTSLR